MPSKKQRRGVFRSEASTSLSSPKADPSNRANRHSWFWALVPVGLALASSINTLWNGFASDDIQQVVRNVLIQDLSNLPLTFTTSVWAFATADVVFAIDSYYRPMFMALFTINYAIFGTAEWGWHLVNVLIHAAATLLVFVMIKQLTDRRELAGMTASLFAVHPSHAESVAWVSGITDPLMALFLLPAFHFYLRYRKGGPRYLLALVVFFYLLALFCKETALALPLVIAYCELFYFRESARLRTRLARVGMLAVVFGAATVVYFAMRYQALSGVLLGSGPRNPLWPSLVTIPLAIVKYLKLMALPVGYSYQHYTELVSSVASVEFIGPLAFVIAVCVAVVFARSRLLALSAVWFILLLAPSLAAIRQFEQEYVVQERYLYLPSIGFCLALALGIERLAASRLVRLPQRLTVAVATSALLVAFGVANVKQNRVWQDTVTVFQNCVTQEPLSAEAHSSLARAYYEAGRIRNADEQARMALDLSPSLPSVYLTRSYFLHQLGRLDGAIEELERGGAAVVEGPVTRYKLATMYLNLGLLYQQKKDSERAEQALRRSLEIWPRAVGWYYAGEFYFDQGRYEEALEMFKLAWTNVPRRYAPIHLKLARTYDRLGDTEGARAGYEKYLELAPGSAESAEVSRRLAQL